MQRLATVTLNGLRRKGWAERSVTHLDGQIRAVFGAHNEPELSNFFAKAEIADDGHSIDYFVSSFSQATPYSALNAAQKQDADDQIAKHVEDLTALLAELSQDAQSNQQNMVAALEGIFYLPNKDSIHMVDGKVVLVGWGYGEERGFVDIRSFMRAPKKVDHEVIFVPWWRRKRWWLLLLLLLLSLGWLLFWIIWPCVLWFKNCEAPIASPDEATLNFGVPSVEIPVTANDTHPEGIPIKLLRCDPPGVVVTDRAATYTREPGVPAGNVTFICEVTDERGLTDRALVTITIDEEPRVPPTAVPDQGVLRLGEGFVEVDVTANDRADKGGPVMIEACAPPGAVRGGNALYLRDPAKIEGSVTFTCTIRDALGETATAPVVIAIEPPNRPPRGTPLVVSLPLSVPQINIPILGAVRDPDTGDTHTVLRCTPHGTVDGTKVTYARPRDETVTQQRFSCTVADREGATAEVPVTVNIERELRNCDPIETAARVHFHIGVDRSSSMDSIGADVVARRAINNILDSAGSNVTISVAMFGNSTVLLEGTRAEVKRQLALLKFDQGTEDFAGFGRSTVTMYNKRKSSIDRFVAVTITDARSGDVTSAIRNFKDLHRERDVKVESSFLYVGPKQNLTKTRAKYGGFVSSGGVFEDLNTSRGGINGLVRSLSDATRLTPRAGCE